MDEVQSLNLVIARLREIGFADIKTEVETYIGSRQTRADIVIDSPDGSPLIVGEVKNKLPAKVDKFHPAITQAFSNANALGCQYFFVADAENMNWYEIKKEGERIQAVEILPSDLFAEMGRRQIETPSVRPSDWSSIVWRFNSILDEFRLALHRVERTNLLLFFLLMKKTAIEHKNEGNYHFGVVSDESLSGTNKRISKLSKIVAGNRFPYSFQRFSDLTESIVQKVVTLLEPYEVTTLDLPKLYQDALVPTFVRAEELQFATRLEVVRFVLATNDFMKAKRIIDPASGIGSFLISAFQKRENIGAVHLTGIDINILSVETVEMALLLGDAKNFSLEKGNFLSKSFDYMRNGKFDFVFCDPPYGGKHLDANELGVSSWVTGNQESISSEILFVIKIIELLNKQGVAMILLPTPVLQLNRWGDFRKRLVSQVDIVASISWANAYGKLNIPAHLLVIQRRTKNPKSTIFMSLTENPDDDNSFDEKINLAVEIYNYYRENGRIKKNTTNIIPVVLADHFTKDFRLDYGAYNIGYKSLVDSLLNSNVQVSKLSDIADIRLGHTYKSIEEDITGDILVIRPSNITHNGLSTELRSISVPDISRAAFVEAGDILLANLGSSYPIAIVPENFPRAVYSNSILRIRLKKNVAIDPRYVHLILSHQVSKAQLEYLSAGATIRRVTPSLLGDLLVPILPRADQENLISKLDLLENYRKLALSIEKELGEMVSEALGWEERDETQP
jgi:type I restriction-modification system DNA methylase subunit